MDLFFELLNIHTPEWYQTFIDGRRLTSEKKQGLSIFLLYELTVLIVYRSNRSRPQSLPSKDKEPPSKFSEKLKLTDQYISLLMVILAKTGLVEVSNSENTAIPADVLIRLLLLCWRKRPQALRYHERPHF